MLQNERARSSFVRFLHFKRLVGRASLVACILWLSVGSPPAASADEGTCASGFQELLRGDLEAAERLFENAVETEAECADSGLAVLRAREADAMEALSACQEAQDAAVDLEASEREQKLAEAASKLRRGALP